MIKRRWFFVGIGLLGLIGGWFTPGAAKPAAAQDGGSKPVPIDTYPLPSGPGAARYSLVDRWDKSDLTFYFHNCPTRLTCGVAQDTIRDAFQTWAEVSALTFREVNRAADADIELRWSFNEDEFGSPGDVLAFAYFPSYGGDVFFDDAEFWTAYGGETDLYVTATHEIGHALGLDHSDDEAAIMFPYLIETSGLDRDDIDGIQRLYGPDTGTGPDVVVSDAAGDLPEAGAVETVDGRISNSEYYELWTIDAKAGETITLTMEALSGDLDAYLGLLTPDQITVLAEDDDSLGGTNSSITYTFPTAGDYVIVATRYDEARGDTSGSYRLTAYRNQTGTVPATPVPAQVNLFISNYSGVVVCGVWISQSDSDDWGEEWLFESGMDSLGLNLYTVWAVPPDTYDVLVSDCFDNTLEIYLVDVMEDTEIQVYEDELVVP
ncbi:MAG: matrixin family metalloprotease [Chloroflexi bacterium]|nr:matrixin family metalloprotease [Chloroflexota bacterium]